MIGRNSLTGDVHFALAGNMLTAVGGTPDIANAAFVPTYPTNVLPGGIPQNLAVDLQPLSHDQLQVFMQIEFPEFPPVARPLGPAAATIGAFYNTMADAFTAINPTIISTAHFVNRGEAVQIKSIADARAAIDRIKGEGEGTPGSPDQPPANGMQFAHYYVFKEIFIGKTLVQAGGGFSFTGPAIQFPTVLPFKQSNASPNPSLAFNQTMSKLLIDLQTCWTSGTDINPAIGDMFALQTSGQNSHPARHPSRVQMGSPVRRVSYAREVVTQDHSAPRGCASSIRTIADKAEFWPVMSCPLVTQRGTRQL